MDKFLNLPLEKQNAIINAALGAFGTNGYRKASVSDIASAAGISKAMIFHYFGTKKELYMYLAGYCGNLIMQEVNQQFDNSVTDFFDRIIQASNIEIAVIMKHPATISFLKSMYFEEDPEIKEDVKSLLAQGEGFRSKIAFEGMDSSKFKDGVEVKLVMKILMWMADGFMNSVKELSGTGFNTLCKEFFDCMKLMRNNFYKEEFLTKN